MQKFADQLERLELAVREAAAGQSGLLTIGAITSAMLEVLPPLVEKLKSEYPQLTISIKEIDSVEAIPALQSGDLDLAFARLEGEMGPTMASLPLREDRLAVALPKSHPLAATPRIHLASLADDGFVMFSRHVSPQYFDSLVSACRVCGFSPRVLNEVRSVASQIAFVGCGQGVALVPSTLRNIAPDNVVVRPLKENVSVVTTAVAWSTARHNPLLDAVIATISASIAAPQARRKKI